MLQSYWFLAHKTLPILYIISAIFAGANDKTLLFLYMISAIFASANAKTLPILYIRVAIFAGVLPLTFLRF